MANSKTSRHVIGVDVGGTFTDMVMLETQTGTVSIAKVPTTLDNQAYGVLSALKEAGAELPQVDLMIHGTTTTTNAVLERKLSRTGLITTQGFRDVLELGRRTRPQPYGMKGEFLPIIPRDLRCEVAERMDYAGRVVTPLDEDGMRQVVKSLLDKGCESLVIHFLHAYANPDHERRAAEIAAELWPNNYITMGHALLSESREFERGVTAAVNASVQPLLERYVNRLVGELKANGFASEMLVMNGNGGTVSSKDVAREAAKTVMSGPASGVIAALHTGQAAGLNHLITYDMGGTSTDVSVIKNGKPSVSNEIEIEYAMPIHVPMIDVRTVGAGGGSIARVNAAGLLEVGPDSAGANPGPICYGRGGDQPTISDANLILGRLKLNKMKSVEGGVSLDAINAVFDTKLGQPLNIDATAAAAAVVMVANAKMAGAIRMVLVSLGADPRDFSLFAFGGAGPLHASAIAKELAIPTVLVPARPGITNALGCVVADLRQDFVQTINTPLAKLDEAVLNEVFILQERNGEDIIRKEPVEILSLQINRSLDMQFVGQTHILNVVFDDLPLPISIDDIQRRFEEVYFNRFRVRLDNIKANIVNVNTSVIGRRAAFDLSQLIDPSGRKSRLADAQTDTRPVYFDGGFHDTPVYQREALPVDAAFDGPAIVEQMDTTILVEPGDHVTSDDEGNLIIHVGSIKEKA
ncbi:MAG: hydantoinase/oxoprolinase family protein [Proteobacteria bacterium]|nr:hydantoinase/oxoprolinase family protein [Pseudomonadota bacterium]MDA0908388.1 hydantoinase/oxoprolinase family protein [Pseudomonadota bacterium]